MYKKKYLFICILWQLWCKHSRFPLMIKFTIFMQGLNKFIHFNWVVNFFT